MDYQNSFTIDLVSNGSMDVYSNNTLSKFQNKIDPPLELDGDWELALNEIYFPLTFTPVLETTIEMTLQKRHVWLASHDDNFAYYIEQNWVDIGEKTTLVVDLNDPIEKIIEKVNKEMEKIYNADKEALQSRLSSRAASLPPKFEIDSNNVITFTAGLLETDETIEPIKVAEQNEKPSHVAILNEDGEPFGKVRFAEIKDDRHIFTRNLYAPYFDNNLFINKLGLHENFLQKMFDSRNYPWKTTGLLLKQENHILLMFIYTDIIRDHHVGGTLAPVLRTVPLTKGVYEGIGYSSFENLVYYPIRKNFIESISILLTQDTGEQIRFAPAGRVFLSLKFQRKVV